MRGIGAMLGVLGLLVPLTAHAEPPTISLVYQAPEECPRAKDFAQLVVARVPDVSVVSQSSPHDATVHVRLETTDSGSSGEVRVLRPDEPAEQRQVEGATCDEVVAALALSVALAVETLETDADPEPQPVEVSADEPRKASGTMLSAALGGLVTQPLSGQVFGGAAVSVDLRLPWYVAGPSLHLGGELSFAADDSAEYRLSAGFIELCPASPIAGRFRFDICGSVQVGSLHAQGTSADVNEEVAPVWAALGGSGRVRFMLVPRVGLEARTYLLAPLTERSFVFENPDRTVSETAHIVPGVTLGAVIRFL